MICAIVLAAGLSSRMGTQKLLLPFGKKTVISHIVDRLLSSKADKIYVVVGHQAEQIEKELSDKQVSIVSNPDYETGMLSSVRAGLRALPSDCTAILVILGDQPSIMPQIVDELIESYSLTGKKIIIPVYNGKRGHPILFSASYKNEILTCYDEVGLRGILKSHESDILEIDVSDSSIVIDMDYPVDYKRILEKYENEKEK